MGAPSNQHFIHFSISGSVRSAKATPEKVVLTPFITRSFQLPVKRKSTGLLSRKQLKLKELRNQSGQKKNPLARQRSGTEEPNSGKLSNCLKNISALKDFAYVKHYY